MKLLAIIYKYYVSHCTAIHSGVGLTKIQSSAAIGFTISPMILLVDFINKWTIDNWLYLTSVSVALVADLIIGIIVHLFYFSDFNTRKMTIKFLEKLFCTYIGLLLFELFSIVFIQYNVEMGAYLKLSIAITVLSYPVLSAFGNLTVITKGKFPPVGWIERLTKFNRSGNINDITNTTSRDEEN